MIFKLKLPHRSNISAVFMRIFKYNKDFNMTLLETNDDHLVYEINLATSLNLFEYKYRI